MSRRCFLSDVSLIDQQVGPLSTCIRSVLRRQTAAVDGVFLSRCKLTEEDTWHSADELMSMWGVSSVPAMWSDMKSGGKKRLGLMKTQAVVWMLKQELSYVRAEWRRSVLWSFIQIYGHAWAHTAITLSCHKIIYLSLFSVELLFPKSGRTFLGRYQELFWLIFKQKCQKCEKLLLFLPLLYRKLDIMVFRLL